MTKKNTNKTSKTERRLLPVSEIRVAKADDTGPAKIHGYAALFDTLSEDLGCFREKIAPGAFTKTIKSDDIRALVDHNSSLILGRNTAGTLSLTEDDKGLLIEIIPPDTQVGRDIVTSIERGDVTQMSFGFQTISDEWNTEDGEEIRTLKEVKLFDISPVTFPAYPDTSVGVRSLEQWRDQNKPEGCMKRMKMELELAGI